MWRGLFAAAVQFARGERVEGVVDERGFARARYAGDASHQAGGDGDVHALEVVAGRPAQVQATLHINMSALARYGDEFVPGEVLSGEGGGVGDNLLRCALRDDFAAEIGRAAG